MLEYSINNTTRTGMMVQGMAKAPRTPFTATYVDDNVEKSQTAMYMGKLDELANTSKHIPGIPKTPISH